MTIRSNVKVQSWSKYLLRPAIQEACPSARRVFTSENTTIYLSALCAKPLCNLDHPTQNHGIYQLCP